jgi:4'-phosphopantetheinyl transferase
VWLIRSDLPSGAFARLDAVLDADERRRADALAQPDRHRFVIAHGAARVVIGGHLGAPPERLRWTYGAHGKPELADPWTTVRVTLSHSGDLAAVALATGRPIGVDVQRFPPGVDPLAMSARYFPEAEARYVAGAADHTGQVDRFVALWARKEACVKAAGGRLTPGLALAVHGCDLVHDRSGEPFRLAEVPVPPGYRAAVALCGGGEFRVTTRWWTG